MSRKTLLSFPDFSKPFHIYADASDYQLGLVIMQDGKALAFYSQKFNNVQCNFTTGKQELLSIVEMLKEFKNILLGQQIIVHTYHKKFIVQKAIYRTTFPLANASRGIPCRICTHERY
jgi:hypothetical protein